ncbi:MAG: hypothetical protein N4A45_06845 [Flavobacteriales bacterium]|jgi:hypothetical protein|nr:hypothetical protein [Flavobacteriales bacterium]
MKKSTQKIQNYKCFKNQLKTIEDLNNLNSQKIILEGIGKTDSYAFLSRGEGKFDLKIESYIWNQEDNESNIDFELFGNLYESKRFGNINRKNSISVSKAPSFETNIELDTFFSKSFEMKSIYKMFFQVELSKIRSFHTEFETVHYQTDETEYFYDCIRIKIDGNIYDVTQYKHKNKGYFIFENFHHQDFEEFNELCFSIQQAIGFISKLMVGNEKFIFDEEGCLYYTNFIRPELKGMYSPITTNPYSNLNIEREIAKQFHPLLTRISLSTLSKLVHKIHYEPEFSIAILILLESTSIRSLLIIPSAFSGIIELLSKHLLNSESGLEYPINDGNLKEKVIEELHKVIDDNCADLSSEYKLKLKRRLNEVNRPINRQRLTNNEKLTRPFELLGINLTLRDIDVIEHRNDLFHGNILMTNSESISDDRINDYMGYVSARLFVLISKLILKCIGYEGYVYNHAKYYDKLYNNQSEEEWFELI